MVDLPAKVDSEQAEARVALASLFESERERVFFSRQLEIMFEDEWFHWITNRALRDLIASGHILSERHALAAGGSLHVVRHRSHRYHRRQTAQLVALVDEYSHHEVSEELGFQGEALVLDGFARHQFVTWGRNIRIYGELEWTTSDHDLDFIFERDGIAYGVEVKNMLGYMDHDELQVKIEVCLALGLRPVFAARMLPRDWINEIYVAGGFALIMKYQMYPKGRRDLVRRMRDELGLPVDTPGALLEGTMQRFLNWHAKNLWIGLGNHRATRKHAGDRGCRLHPYEYVVSSEAVPHCRQSPSTSQRKATGLREVSDDGGDTFLQRGQHDSDTPR